jgi:hypothetical protein
MDKRTHSKNGWVIWNLRAWGFWLVFLLGDANILHIAASEDNVFVDT